MNQQDYDRHITALLDSRQEIREARAAIEAARDATRLAHEAQKSLAAQAYRAGMPVEAIAEAIGRSVQLVSDMVVTAAQATASHRVWTAAEITAKPEELPQTQPQRRVRQTAGMRQRTRTGTRNS
jgi:hypothetical protein